MSEWFENNEIEHACKNNDMTLLTAITETFTIMLINCCSETYQNMCPQKVTTESLAVSKHILQS